MVCPFHFIDDSHGNNICSDKEEEEAQLWRDYGACSPSIVDG